MTTARAFHGFRFPAEVILWAVRWYLQFPISYRDLERMLTDRGVAVDHTTMYRRVQRFARELEKRMRQHADFSGMAKEPSVEPGWRHGLGGRAGSQPKRDETRPPPQRLTPLKSAHPCIDMQLAGRVPDPRVVDPQRLSQLSYRSIGTGAGC